MQLISLRPMVSSKMMYDSSQYDLWFREKCTTLNNLNNNVNSGIIPGMAVPIPRLIPQIDDALLCLIGPMPVTEFPENTPMTMAKPPKSNHNNYTNKIKPRAYRYNHKKQKKTMSIFHGKHIYMLNAFREFFSTINHTYKYHTYVYVCIENI